MSANWTRPGEIQCPEGIDKATFRARNLRGSIDKLRNLESGFGFRFFRSKPESDAPPPEWRAKQSRLGARHWFGSVFAQKYSDTARSRLREFVGEAFGRSHPVHRVRAAIADTKAAAAIQRAGQDRCPEATRRRSSESRWTSRPAASRGN